MKVNLTPELKTWMQTKIRSGAYESENQIVENAVRLLFRYEEKRLSEIEHLRSELKLGIEQLEQGLSRSFNEDLVDQIKRTGRAKMKKQLQ